MLRKIGSVREREGHLSYALRWYSRASRALTAVHEGDERRLEEAEIALARAGTLHRQGRNRMSANFAGLAAAAAEAGHDPLALARAYNILWVAQTSLGVADAAIWARKALEMYQGSGDLVGEANVLNNLGVEAYFAGDWSAAVEYYTVSRDLRRQAGDVAGEALAANNVAEVLSLQGRYEEASELFGFAQRTWESAGYPLFVAFAMANLALVRARAGEPRAGLATLGSARFLSLELGASALRLEMDVRRIECLLLDRQFERALAEAVPLCEELDAHHEGDNELTTQLLPLLALAQWVTGDHLASEATLWRTVQQAEAESNHYVAALGSLVEAELAATRGVDPAEARDRASDMLERLGLVAVPAVVALVLPSLSLRLCDRLSGGRG